MNIFLYRQYCAYHKIFSKSSTKRVRFSLRLSCSNKRQVCASRKTRISTEYRHLVQSPIQNIFSYSIFFLFLATTERWRCWWEFFLCLCGYVCTRMLFTKFIFCIWNKPYFILLYFNFAYQYVHKDLMRLIVCLDKVFLLILLYYYIFLFTYFCYI